MQQNFSWQFQDWGFVLDIHPTKSYGVTNRLLFKETGKTPVVVNSSMGNGIGGYVDLAPTEKGNMITYTDTTTSEGIFTNKTTLLGILTFKDYIH